MIAGTGRALPARVVTNDDLAREIDTSDEWIRTRTGIRERRWITPGETGVALGLAAAREALAMADVPATKVDAIVYATSTPDHFLPGNGVFLQRALGLGPVPAIDVRMQCAGFVYALSIANLYVQSGQFRCALVVGQEIQSTRMDLSSRGRSTAVLFADGAGAVVLQPGDDPERGILSFDLHSDGAHAESLWVDEPGSIHDPTIDLERYQAGRYFLEMDGKEVFRHAVLRMPESVRTCLDRIGRSPADIDLLIAHQANQRITDQVQENLGLRSEQVYGNIARYGNTTAATIPIALDECVRGGRLTTGDLLVLTAFGSGFVWGSAAIRW
jgi:3-oxoacyl-[acyl-carrier-protein] synthase-3